MDLTEIYDLLYWLGITAKYAGFFHASYAIFIAKQQPDRLALVTKWLYPEVARRYNTNWRAVEKNIRTVVSVAWETRPRQLEHIAHQKLEHKPKNTQFLKMLALYTPEKQSV